MLYTNLKHIESAAEHQQIIDENENVMIVCGRMGPTCIPVYRIAEELENEYKQVKFCDMEFDNPESLVIRDSPDVRNFLKIPFTIFYKNGQIIEVTSGIQTKEEISAILNKQFSIAVTA